MDKKQTATHHIASSYQRLGCGYDYWLETGRAKEQRRVAMRQAIAKATRRLCLLCVLGLSVLLAAGGHV
jgi:hypothetical protein